MLACLCNYFRLFSCFQVMPNLAWYHHFTACLLDDTFTNKIDRFIDYDGDRETKFESIFTIVSISPTSLCDQKARPFVKL